MIVALFIKLFNGIPWFNNLYSFTFISQRLYMERIGRKLFINVCYDVYALYFLRRVCAHLVINLLLYR